MAFPAAIYGMTKEGGMSDLISREAVIAALTDTLQYEGMVMDELISVVANIPAADVVEVKKDRCEDCQEWDCEGCEYER